MSYQRLLDKVERSTSGGAEGLDHCFRPLFGKEDRRRDQLEPLAKLNAWIEKSVRLDPQTEDAKVLLPQLTDQGAAAQQERDAGVLAISTLAKPHTSDFKEFGLPQVIRTDNGVPFASAHALCGFSKVAVWWLRLGIQIELEDLTYPLTATVTRCGRICFNRRKINLSQVCAGQNVGVTQIGERIWLVTFMDYDLRYFDDETCRLEPIDNPFGPKVLPMSPE